jgi:glycosyltransferase involved in cell wall biosynthesis
MDTNNNRHPYFSIVIPTYNRAHLIGETIKSILLQDYLSFEVLVIDDGSKDNTQEVVQQFKDERIHYFKKENGERGAARNYGQVRAVGQYINFFDSDDLMYPAHLAAAQKLIEERNSPEFFHLGYDFKTPDGRVTRRIDQLDDSVAKKVLFDNILSCNGVFVRKDIAMQFPFEENRQMASAEDWELWIRLISRYPLHYSNQITTSVVGHDQRSIFTIASKKVIERDRMLVDKLKQDAQVMKAYAKGFNSFIASRYTFIMLCLAEERQRIEVISWALRAIKVYPLILFTKRFLSSLRKILIS